jgi:hypothetical protein
MASPRPRYASIEGPLRNAGLPDLSSAPRRIGATIRPDTRHRLSGVGPAESPVPLQSPTSARGQEATRRRAASALLGVGTTLLQLPSRVAASWFTAPPARFRPPWGSPREATPHAFACGCAGRALGPPSGVSEPVRPLPTRRPRDDSPGIYAPTAHTSAEDPVHPGDSAPRHLPPSGFGYPPGGFLSSAPRDGPSTATAPMGFALQGLAPPRQRRLSRGLASHVVLPVRPKAGGRDSRG